MKVNTETLDFAAKIFDLWNFVQRKWQKDSNSTRNIKLAVNAKLVSTVIKLSQTQTRLPALFADGGMSAIQWDHLGKIALCFSADIGFFRNTLTVARTNIHLKL